MDLHSFTYNLIDHTTINRKDTIASFATDDLLCELVGKEELEPLIRLWRHDNSIVLGIMDMKLPKLEAGIDFLESKGYTCRVRNSGGLAVVLDEGVINLTLLLPEEKTKIQIDTGYEFMWNLIKVLLKEFSVEVEAKEIVGSYCPGSYDLSIKGKKFAGISQRRIKKALAVQIYICLTGSGSKRAETIRQFYQVAEAITAERNIYPDITPHVMASLNELIGVQLTEEQWKDKIIKVLKESELIGNEVNFVSQENEKYAYYYERMIERNKELLK